MAINGMVKPLPVRLITILVVLLTPVAVLAAEPVLISRDVKTASDSGDAVESQDGVAQQPAEQDGDPRPDYQLYNRSRGLLQCADAGPYLHRRDVTYCGQLDAETVRCELVGGYKRVAGTFSTLMYGIGLFRLLAAQAEAEVAGSGGRRWRGRCVEQTFYEMRRVTRLPAGVPVVEDTVLQKNVERAERLAAGHADEGDAGDEGDAVQLFLSQGLQRLLLDFGPGRQGVGGAFLRQEGCASCPPEMWSVELVVDPGVFADHLNLVRRLELEVLPAFAILSSKVLLLLRTEALVQRVAVHGGARWDERVLFAQPLPSLRSLDLSASGLSALADDNFIRTPNLRHLDLSRNHFASLPEGIRFLKQLETLDVSGNPMTSPSFAPVLRSLGQLESLNVSGIPLGSLDALAPEENEVGSNSEEPRGDEMFGRLQVLDLSRCNLSTLETSAAQRLLPRLRSLRTLRLASNSLRALPAWLAARLPALQLLDASGCLLRAAPGLRLAPGQRLLRLDLSRNQLASPAGAVAPAGAGAGAEEEAGPRLALLDLSGNALRADAWGADAFEGLGAGAAVNLSHAELPALSPAMLRSLRHLRWVDLGWNALDCGRCAVRHLQQWLSDRNNSAQVLIGGRRAPLQCAEPPSERGRAVADASGPEQCAGAPPEGAWRAQVALGAAAAAVVVLASGALALLAVRFRLELTYVLHALRANRALRAKGSARRPCDFDAFVCYSKHDRAWVLGELLPRLEGGHPRYRLCLHERDFPLGSFIVQNIVECMARSRRTLMVLTPAFVDSQWCQWELEMATHRLLEGAGRDFLVLVELRPVEARALPRLLRLLVETRTYLQWPPPAATAGAGGGAEAEAEAAAWTRLRAALGPPCVLHAADAPPPAPVLPSYESVSLSAVG